MSSVAIESRIDIKTLANILLDLRSRGVYIVGKSALVRNAVEAYSSTIQHPIVDDAEAFDLLSNSGMLSRSRKLTKDTIISVSTDKDVSKQPVYDPRFFEAVRFLHNDSQHDSQQGEKSE